MSRTRSAATGVAEKTAHDFVTRRERLSQVYSDDELERVQIVREGLPAQFIDVMSTTLRVSKGTVFELLGISKATANRLARGEKNLSRNATERAVFIAGLVKTVEVMIPERNVDAESFDASAWVAKWLEEPQPALGGKTPGSFMDTADGRRIVRRLLGQMETGTYA